MTSLTSAVRVTAAELKTLRDVEAHVAIDASKSNLITNLALIYLLFDDDNQMEPHDVAKRLKKINCTLSRDEIELLIEQFDGDHEDRHLWYRGARNFYTALPAYR